MIDTAARLRRYYVFYIFGFIAFVLALWGLEGYGMPPRWIGYAFLCMTILLYATIGILARTANVAEYYVAGRRIPALFNGMATGADWMSAASFIGLAGTLYHSGYQGLAYVMGWTGGYVLVALLLAPYLRRFGQYTIAEYLGARYGGNAARLVGVLATVVASFVYVVAQIYGVGVITSRFVGLQFEIGVFVGLAGILVCSFLGGMRAVTWTQVAQYLILIVAYLVPVTMLAYKTTEVPVPQLMYGSVLERVADLERRLLDDPHEAAVRAVYLERAAELQARIERLPDSLLEERRSLTQQIDAMKAGDARMRDVVALEKQRRDLPRTPEAAREYWQGQKQQAERQAEPLIPHAEPFPGEDEGARSQARLNFLSLVFGLMQLAGQVLMDGGSQHGKTLQKTRSSLAVAGVNIVVLPGAGLGEFNNLHRQGQRPARVQRGKVRLDHLEQLIPHLLLGLGAAPGADFQGEMNKGVVRAAVGHAVFRQAQGAGADAAGRKHATLGNQDVVGFFQQGGNIRLGFQVVGVFVNQVRHGRLLAGCGDGRRRPG